MPLTTRGLSPLFLATNALIWISATIVMGILAYWFSRDQVQSDANIYILVVVSGTPPPVARTYSLKRARSLS